MNLPTHRPPRRRRLALAAALAVIVGLALAQTPTNPITFRSEIYIVSQVTAEDGSREERFTAATSAIPGQVVEYRIFATNAGETTLPAGRVQIFGPVQEGMSYVANSATPSSDRVLTDTNPFDDSVVATIRLASAEEVDAAYASVRSGRPSRVELTTSL